MWIFWNILAILLCTTFLVDFFSPKTFFMAAPQRKSARELLECTIDCRGKWSVITIDVSLKKTSFLSSGGPGILVSCITDNFSVLIIVITEEWISISAEILPGFRAFPVQGPNITSRAVAREVMLGPKDRKCPKNGQNRGGNGYSSEGMSMISKLKLSVIHIILCYSRDFALPKTWFLSSCLTTKSLYVRFIF